MINEHDVKKVEAVRFWSRGAWWFILKEEDVFYVFRQGPKGLAPRLVARPLKRFPILGCKKQPAFELFDLSKNKRLSRAERIDDLLLNLEDYTFSSSGMGGGADLDNEVPF